MQGAASSKPVPFRRTLTFAWGREEKGGEEGKEGRKMEKEEGRLSLIHI